MGENNRNDAENPWENASNDDAFREQTESQNGDPQTSGEPSTPAVTSVRWDVDDNNHSSGNAGNDVSLLTTDTPRAADTTGRGSRAKCFSKCSMKHFLHVWDILLTTCWTALVGYHLYYNKQNETSRTFAMDSLIILCIILTTLNALRGILWIWASLPALSTICCCGCCFVDDNGAMRMVSKSSTNLTLLLGVVYGSIALAAWFGPSTWLPWCGGFGPWCSKYVHAKTIMPVALSVASVIEMLRWVFLQGQLSSTVAMETTRSPDYYNDDFSSQPSQTSRNRPWWFSGRSRGGSTNGNNEGLSDPLLGGSGNRQPSWTTPSWIPFANRARNTNYQDENIPTPDIDGDEDDVESVLDSLAEDWASNTESDPYWWTR